MKEAFGNAFVVQFVIIFIILFIFFFVSSFSYTKAFKIKNRIVDIIEQHDGYNAEAKEEINSVLSEAEYRISNKTSCSSENIATNVKNYNYCVYKKGTEDKTYYQVVAYMYFDIPIIGVNAEIPVKGETRIMNIIG